MSRQIKCKWCGVKDDKEKMIKGVHPQGYLHIDVCLEEYNKDKLEKSKVKCFLCGFKDFKENMEKKSEGYIHKEICLIKYEKDKAFKRKEQEELDELTDTIVRIMGYSGRQSIPSQFYSSYLQPFRNNDVLYGRIQKRYKEGFSYKTIKETFEYCEKDIKKYLNQKRANGDFKDVMGELRYVWAIVRNNIENMLRDKRKKNNNKVDNQKLISYIDQTNELNIRIKEKQNEQIKIKKENKIDLTKIFE